MSIRRMIGSILLLLLMMGPASAQEAERDLYAVLWELDATIAWNPADGHLDAWG